MTGEESDATGENDNDLDDDHPSKKKKSLCKVKGCGKLDKGRGFCKLVSPMPSHSLGPLA